MKLTLASTALAFATASANPHFIGKRVSGGSFGSWTPPSDADLRGPCPMMNTLANHAFLPHNGSGITLDVLTGALGDALNFDADLAKIMFQMAIVANPEANATEFSLGNLNRHNVLEHDASMTRSDDFFGSNHIFNQTVFDETRSYWPDELLTAQQLANGRLARQITSRSTNPTYTFTSSTEQFSLGEVSAPIIAFGELETFTTNRTLVEYWIQNERFPVELGWQRTNQSISVTLIGTATAAIANYTSLLTTGVPVVTDKRRSTVVDSHFGKLTV